MNGERILAFISSDYISRDAQGFVDLSNLNLSLYQRVEIACKTIEFPWDIVKYNSDEILADLEHISSSTDIKNWVISTNNYIHNSATISSHSVLDSTNGPITIDADATIEAFTYIKGPCYIGKHSVVKANSTITNSSIHSHCRIFWRNFNIYST